MISIIIVNWNSGSQLAQVVYSIAEFHHSLVSSVVIVDNASSDDSLLQLENLHDLSFPLYIVRNINNKGFGAACNQGVALVTGATLLFLNPDAILKFNTLPYIVRYLQAPANTNVGIFGVQLIDVSGYVSHSCSRFPTPFTFVAHAIGLDRLFPRIGHVMAEWTHDTTRDVDHVIGAFFLVRGQLFKSLGGFDERFFVYLEDLDFSYRARQAGWRSVYLADVQAFHAGGGTSNQVKARRLFYSLRSRVLYSFKHFSTSGALLVLISTLLIEPVSRLTLAASRRSWSSFKETCVGYSLLWHWLPQWVFKGTTR